MIPSELQDPEKVTLSWNITSRTAQSIFIQLDFDEPLFISFEEADVLEINFGDPDLFISTNGIQILEENRKISR